VRDDAVLERIAALAIPPAWKEVWICPWPSGHIQATGVDAAGRRQYLYHPEWRERRDRQKFDRALRFARRLPRLRATVAEHLALAGPVRERVLACATRLLDRGFFRIGREEYAEEHNTFGLATILREHVRLAPGGVILFDYPAKGGIRRRLRVVDREACEVLRELKRRRHGDDLLAYRNERSWIDVRSGDVNAYLKQLAGGDFSAKDFRTWHATVLAAAALAVEGPRPQSERSQKLAISRAVKEVAHYLGNTPAVCRASYVDPRVFERYREGKTIAAGLEELADLAEAAPEDGLRTAERAVIQLLTRG
jgi:DNA topoisomerase IB